MGCNSTLDCPDSEVCCTGVCVNTATDLANCGECGNECPTIQNADVACEAPGTCEFAGCDDGWADCNLDVSDGCEWDVTNDGPCTCEPGETTPCYEGPLGTDGVGLAVPGVHRIRHVHKGRYGESRAAALVRGKIRSIVRDPAVARLLEPRQVIGCKRLCLDSGYYETFNRPNVHLVDISGAPIEAITPRMIGSRAMMMLPSGEGWTRSWRSQSTSISRTSSLGRAQACASQMVTS